MVALALCEDPRMHRKGICLDYYFELCDCLHLSSLVTKSRYGSDPSRPPHAHKEN
jgi:hypothetical protein